MKNQKGFTLTELLVLLWMVLILSAVIGTGYIAIHFLQKFW